MSKYRAGRAAPSLMLMLMLVLVLVRVRELPVMRHFALAAEIWDGWTMRRGSRRSGLAPLRRASARS